MVNPRYDEMYSVSLVERSFSETCSVDLACFPKYVTLVLTSDFCPFLE